MVYSAFGFAGRGLWGDLDRRRAGPATSGIVPIAPLMPAEIKFFGRFKSVSIRDGVLLAISGCGCLVVRRRRRRGGV